MTAAYPQWTFQESGYGTCQGERCTLEHQYQLFLKVTEQDTVEYLDMAVWVWFQKG